MSADEKIALDSICRTLLARDIFVVKPQNLDISPILGEYPQLKTVDFAPDYFNGIKGYNRLMTSPEFYGAFGEYDYILVAQLDAYIFSDELDAWCAKGYDYVGAPWLKRTVNRYPPMAWIKKIEDWRRRRKGLYSKIALYDKVGNGGLSLRRIASHRRVCELKKDEIAALNEIGPKGQPEDVFWARQEAFNYPTAQEALSFAFDKYPAWCYRLNGNRLPMGCHGWSSRKMRSFWQKIIPRSPTAP